MIEDIALMRAMPKMQVVVPADYNQAYTAVIESYERFDGPMYMRFGRPKTPVVYEEIPETLGTGVDVLRPGKDISIFVCGHMVWRGLEAGETLEREDGVEAEVVNVSIIKPIDSQSVLRSLAKTGVAVTAEEHRVVGGLGDAIRQVAAEQHPVPVFALGMQDEFGVSGTAEACMEHFGLTASGIADLAREALLKKPIVQHPPLHGGPWAQLRRSPDSRCSGLRVWYAVFAGTVQVSGGSLGVDVGLGGLDVICVAVDVGAIASRLLRSGPVLQRAAAVVLVGGAFLEKLLGLLEAL